MSKIIFRRVILFARKHRIDQDVAETLQRLIKFLSTHRLKVFVDSEAANILDVKLPVLPPTQMQKETDLVIVVGGDGSLLSAARMAVQFDVPITGISRGRLGFLTDISANKIEEQLLAILQGNYSEEKRDLLQAQIMDDKRSYFEGLCLNDMVLSRGNETHLVEFSVSINKQFVSQYRSDGLILSTPTGSTAYALSAGGPIIHPELNAILMVPMFSHSFSNRPLVFADSAEVEINISQNNFHNLQVSCDGHESQYVEPGQKVLIKKHHQSIRLLHPNDYNYYDTLRLKLGWGQQG